jgi:hypothetical protein
VKRERLHVLALASAPKKENHLFLNIDLVRGSSGKRPEKGKKSASSFPAHHNPSKIGPQAANVALARVWGGIGMASLRLLGRSERFWHAGKAYG